MNTHANLNPDVDKGMVLTVILMSSFFNPFMASAVNIALPEISLEFKMGAVAMSWVAMAFLLASATFLVPFGKLADIWGRKRLFYYGNIVFTIATLFCAFSVSSEMLIVSRFLQGIGSAMVFGTGMALALSVFPPEQRGRVIGYSVSAVYIGLSAAPLLGGLLTQWIGWRSLFFINAVAGMFIIFVVATRIKAEWAEAGHEQFDIKGAAIYVVAILSLMFGFSHLPRMYAIVLTVFGIAGLYIFVKTELKTSEPVLNISLFKNNRVFAFSNLAALINYAATFAITFILSLYLQHVKMLSPSDAGLILVTQPMFMALVASFSGRLSDKKDPRVLASLGMAIIVAGLCMLIPIHAGTSSVYLIVSLVVLGFGFGLFSSPNTNSVMGSVEKRYLGVASATIGTMRLTGQMFSMAIAALCIHVFVGKNPLNETTMDGFLNASRLIFSIFAVLCVLGVFASLARGAKLKA